MKRIIKKFWGVGLIVILLSAMFVGGAVPAANAGTLAWSSQVIPVATYNQLTNGTDLSYLTVAPNGDLFAVDTQVGGTVATQNQIYKSIDGGRTWTVSAVLTGIGTYTNGVVALAVSPNYATDSYVFVVASTAATSQVYVSINGGVSFSVLGGTIAGRATCLAIAPNYISGSGEVMVGTVDPTATAGDATLGNVWIWGYNSTLNWQATALAADVTSVAYSPNYALDGTRIAVGSQLANPITVANTGYTVVHTKVATAAWDLTLTNPTALNTGASPAVALPVADFFNAGGINVISSAIAIPSDLNASLFTSRTLYVSLTSGTAANNNVFRVVLNGGLALVYAVPMNPMAGIPMNSTMSSLAYSGTGAAGTLFAGYAGGILGPFVAFSANPMAAAASIAWGYNFKAPTGGAAGSTYVALAPDFATSAKVYASTTGADSAVSVSVEGGYYFNQIGAIDTTIAAIDDFQVVNATTYLMTTHNTGTTYCSLWKSADSGATWNRYLSVLVAGGTTAIIVRLSPNFATDNTLLVGLVGNAGAGNIQVSNTGGSYFVGRSVGVTVQDIAVKDMNTFYVASGAAGTVQATANGGWTWQPAATTVAAACTINQIKLNLATGNLMVGTSIGKVYLSKDNNVTWASLGAAIAAAPAIVEFDSGYATNNIIYAACTTAAGVWSWTVGTSLNWAAIDGSLTLLPRSIISAADGALYVSDATPSAQAAGFSTAGGVMRSINPTWGVYSTFQRISSGTFFDLLPAGDTLSKLAISPSPNQLFAINNLAGFISVRTYTDTMSGLSAPTILTPAANAIIDNTANAFAFSFNAVPGAMGYGTRWDTRTDFLTARAGPAVAWPSTSGVIAAGLLPAGATIYFQVRVTSPLIGPWSATLTFQTQLAPLALNAPGIAPAVAAGMTGIGGWDVAVSPTFSWTAVAGATAYEFQLAKDAAFTNLVVDASGANALGAVTAYKYTGELKNSTTYYWRVRAISATSNTDWSTTAPFTTLAAPPVSPPPTTSAPPVITTFTFPPATTTQVVITQAAEQKISPTYIWAIIIIGAVLVLAVIVLIVRTRRPV